jgi:hypothetical protein
MSRWHVMAHGRMPISGQYTCRAGLTVHALTERGAIRRARRQVRRWLMSDDLSYRAWRA